VTPTKQYVTLPTNDVMLTSQDQHCSKVVNDMSSTWWWSLSTGEYDSGTTVEINLNT